MVWQSFAHRLQTKGEGGATVEEGGRGVPLWQSFACRLQTKEEGGAAAEEGGCAVPLWCGHLLHTVAEEEGGDMAEEGGRGVPLWCGSVLHTVADRGGRCCGSTRWPWSPTVVWSSLAHSDRQRKREIPWQRLPLLSSWSSCQTAGCFRC